MNVLHRGPANIFRPKRTLIWVKNSGYRNINHPQPPTPMTETMVKIILIFTGFMRLLQ